MNKYIDAEKLIADIERLKERYGSIIPKSITAQNYQEGRLIGYEDVLYKIKESLQQEQPEVDLEKELDSLITPELKKYKALPSMMDVAKHFYELGLNARKEE